MEGERGIGVVGIGVGPCPGHRGVVHRKELEHLLSGHGAPVDHLLEIHEIAGSEILLAADGEHGYGGAGGFPISLRIAQAQAAVFYHGRGTLGHAEAYAVVAVLPRHQRSRPFLNHEFVLEGELHPFEGERALPQRIAGVGEHHRLGGVPRAQRVYLAADSHDLVRRDHRREYLKHYAAADYRRIRRAVLARQHTLHKRR